MVIGITFIVMDIWHTTVEGYTLDSNGAWIQDLLELAWANLNSSTSFDAESQKNMSENN